MKRPPTMNEAAERGLTVEKGICTFSNGSHWDGWADANCYECKHWNPDDAGDCAFEGYSFLGMVSPALAILFGWTEDADYPGSYDEPEQCAFFAQKSDSDDDDTPPAPEPDPLQLVLIADPTEDIAGISPAREREVQHA